MEIVSLKNVNKESKIALLEKLGYDSDGKYVLENGKKKLDEYTQKEITLENMAILPGSVIVLNEASAIVLKYLEEHEDDF